MLQVHKTLDRKDPNGYQGMKIGLYVLSFMLLLYGGLLVIITAYHEPHNGKHIIYVFDLIFNAGKTYQLLT